MAAVHIPQPELVGREAEFDAIESFLSRRESDGPPALVLEGEAGIGKTTLWREGLALADARSYRVLVARPASPEFEMPFAGLADLLGGSVDDVLPRLPEPQRQALATALLLVEPDGSPPRPHTIAAAVLSYLRELSRADPVLVAIDDVQWLDSSSRGALEFALRRIVEDRRITFLYSWRTGGDERPPLSADGLRDGSVQRVNVGPLSLGALHRVITTHLGHSLSRPVLARVHAVSGGNPFFALELARVADQRRVPTAALELPYPRVSPTRSGSASRLSLQARGTRWSQSLQSRLRRSTCSKGLSGRTRDPDSSQQSTPGCSSSTRAASVSRTR